MKGEHKSGKSAQLPGLKGGLCVASLLTVIDCGVWQAERSCDKHAPAGNSVEVFLLRSLATPRDVEICA